MLGGMEQATASGFWTAGRKRFWMIGGSLIVLAGLVVLAVFLVASQPEEGPRSAGKGELAAFLSDEHKAAFREGTRLEAKYTITDAAKLGEGLAQWLGTNKPFEELFPGSGVKLLGAGKSAVPGAGESAHLRLAAEGTAAEMSLFIKQYRQLPRVDEGMYTLPGRGTVIEVWRRGGLLYFLVSNTAEGVAVLRKGMGAPEPIKPY